MLIWVTGISGAGKTTLCEALWQKLKPTLPELSLLDGDVIRNVFGGDLGHAEADRVVQIKRIQSLAQMLYDQNFVVLVAALYSHPDLLAWNREKFGEYYEVYIDASLPLVKERDPKGIYAMAEAGEMPNVVGVDIPWHAPVAPDLTFTADDGDSPELMAQKVMESIPRLRKVLERSS